MSVRTKWYSLDVRNDTAELSIFDEIGGWGISVAEFAAQFNLVRNQKAIRLLLNSPGGSITEGMALYNILASVRDKLTIEVVGVAASIASVIALAGKELVMDEGTYLMIHNPWVITWGDSDQLRKDAATLDKMRGELLSIYVAHSNKTEDEIGEMMDDETWLTADEAEQAGFATTVTHEAKAVALSFNIARIGFQNTPEALASQVPFKSIKTIRDFETFLRDSGASCTEALSLASGGWKSLHRDDAVSHTEDGAIVIAALRAAATILS